MSNLHLTPYLVHGHIFSLFHIPDGDAAFKQRWFKGKTASDVESDEVVEVEAQQVVDILSRQTTVHVHRVRRKVAAERKSDISYELHRR